MQSYIDKNTHKGSDSWLEKKFDTLYDMDVDTLQYLAALRNIKIEKQNSDMVN